MSRRFRFTSYQIQVFKFQKLKRKIKVQRQEIKMKVIVLIAFFACVFGVYGQLPSPTPIAVSQSIDCTICQFMVTEIDYFIKQNYTVREIVTYINATCSSGIFSGYTQVCESIASMGLFEFIKYIETNENPTTICQTQFNFCSSDIKLPRLAAGESKRGNISAFKHAISKRHHV